MWFPLIDVNVFCWCPITRWKIYFCINQRVWFGSVQLLALNSLTYLILFFFCFTIFYLFIVDMFHLQFLHFPLFCIFALSKNIILLFNVAKELRLKRKKLVNGYFNDRNGHGEHFQQSTIIVVQHQPFSIRSHNGSPPAHKKRMWLIQQGGRHLFSSIYQKMAPTVLVPPSRRVVVGSKCKIL